MGSVRLVCLSDTHLKHADLDVPDGDILLHAGDATTRGTAEELAVFAEWMNAQPHQHKVLVAGNHDFLFESDRQRAGSIMGEVTYLQDEGISLLGLRLWGTPWLPVFKDWAFNLPRGQALAEKWALIPEDTDLLITHGPAWGRMDLTTRGEHVGCEDLVHAVDRVKPKLHMFGHIHEAYGARMQGETLLVNAASCNRWFELTNAPIVIDWEPGGEPRVVAPG